MNVLVLGDLCVLCGSIDPPAAIDAEVVHFGTGKSLLAWRGTAMLLHTTKQLSFFIVRFAGKSYVGNVDFILSGIFPTTEVKSE